MENQENFDPHPFRETLDQIGDSRNQKIIHYSVPEVLFLVLIGSLCGIDELTVIETFGEEKLSWLQKYYPYKKGTPSHDTLSRVLGMIDKNKFEELFVAWVADHFKIEADVINIDGKRLSSSANRSDQSKKKGQGGKYAQIIVNAYAQGAGIALAQNNVSDKMDELKGALQLLDWLSLEGCCITGDSNFCRAKIINKVIENKANYMLGLKQNNPTAYDLAEQAFANKEIEKTTFETREKGHGREEVRIYKAISVNESSIELKTRFPNLQQIVQVYRERKVVRKDKQSTEVHYYITDLKSPIEQLADTIRKHWSIENQLHYVLDVSFKEDQSRVRIKNAATNFSVIRKMSFNILKSNKDKGSMKSKRMRCAISDSKRETILNNFMMR